MRKTGTLERSPQNPPKEERKCYWIDSPFPRNLILREKLLIVNKGLAAEVQAVLSAAAGTTKADDLSKAEGLSLQGRHLEYADFSQSSLPNADLRRARMKAANFSGAKLEKAHLENAQLPGANLFKADLPGADLTFAELPGANLPNAKLPGADLTMAQLPGANLYEAELSGAILQGTQLTGADLSNVLLTGADLSKAELPGVILKNINYEPMEKDQANAEADKLYSALKDLPKYRGEINQTALANKIEKFRQRITSSVDFSDLEASEDCLADESMLKDLPPCKKTDDPEARKSAYEIWARLAYEDSTEKHWIAQRMVQRAEEDTRFPGFVALLAAKLHTGDKCPGLAGLDDKSKKILLDAAKKTR